MSRSVRGWRIYMRFAAKAQRSAHHRQHIKGMVDRRRIGRRLRSFNISAISRLGYLTEFSQPGVPGSPRASVAGFCERSQGECLASLSLSSDLVVVSEYPGVEATYEVPITQDQGRTFTILAGRPILDPSCGFHPQTLSALSNCLYVSIVDPCWGRNDLLWTSVIAALKRDPAECMGSLIDPANFLGQRRDHGPAF